MSVLGKYKTPINSTGKAAGLKIVNKVNRVKTIPLQIIENVTTPMFLEFLRYQFQESEDWSFKYPHGAHFSKRHPKLTIIDGETKNPKTERIAGMCLALLTQIYEKSGGKLFYPEALWCGGSIKDQHRKDNTHTDHEDDIPKNMKVLKILGVLNSDWKEEWGGGFEWNKETYYAPPTSFYVFNPLIPHRAADIVTHEKRIAIDFTVRSMIEF